MNFFHFGCMCFIISTLSLFMKNKLQRKNLYLSYLLSIITYHTHPNVKCPTQPTKISSIYYWKWSHNKWLWLEERWLSRVYIIHGRIKWLFRTQFIWINIKDIINSYKSSACILRSIFHALLHILNILSYIHSYPNLYIWFFSLILNIFLFFKNISHLSSFTHTLFISIYLRNLLA